MSAEVFDKFDYVALGHIHRPQKMGRETLRYSGTPLKYSFSEVDHKKSVTIVELLEKGNVQINTVSIGSYEGYAKSSRNLYGSDGEGEVYCGE